MRTLMLLATSLLFVMLWSSGWIVSQYATYELSVVTLLSTRYLIVLAVVTVLLFLSRGWRSFRHINIKGHLLVGVLSHALYLLTGVGAFELGVSAALVAFVTSLQPMCTATMSRTVTNERVSRRQLKGLLMGICAVAVLLSDSYSDGVSGIALLFPVIAVLALSAGTLIHRRIELNTAACGKRPDPLIPVLFLHATGALLVLLPMSAFHQPLTLDFNTSQWLVILWLAIVVSLGAYGLMLLLLRWLSAMQVSSLSYLVPPATLLQSWVVLGSPVSKAELLSLLLASVGVYLVMRPASKKRRRVYPTRTVSSPAS